MKDPEINGERSKTARREYRKRAPYILANRRDLDEARAKGCNRCGYKGPAITFLTLVLGIRRPSGTTEVSRKAFLKALRGSEAVCMNCATEARGHKGGHAKKRVCVSTPSTSKTERALAKAGLVSEVPLLPRQSDVETQSHTVS